MKHGFCHLSQVAVRIHPSHQAEMVNQLLFGETYEILDSVNNWKLIRGSFDQYEGFIEEKQVLLLDDEEWKRLLGEKVYFTSEIVNYVSEVENSHRFLIVAGSSLPGLQNQYFSIAGKKYHFHGEAVEIPSVKLGDKIPETAMKYLGAPYLWGGRSPFGIDCSGLVQVVFNMVGIKLPRDAANQAQVGETIHLHEEALPGDLAFFDNSEGKIVHVGILKDKNSIIHASGQVRIDAIDHHGIFNNDLKKYTHQLRLIKRIIPLKI